MANKIRTSQSFIHFQSELKTMPPWVETSLYCGWLATAVIYASYVVVPLYFKLTSPDEPSLMALVGDSIRFLKEVITDELLLLLKAAYIAIFAAFLAMITYGVHQVVKKISRDKLAIYEAEMEYDRALFEAEMTYKTELFEAENDSDSLQGAMENDNDSAEVDAKTAKFRAEMDCKRALFEAEMALKSRLAPLNVKTERDRAIDRVKQLCKKFTALKEQRRRECLQQLSQVHVPLTEYEVMAIELDIARETARQYFCPSRFEPAGENDTLHVNDIYSLLQKQPGLIKPANDAA
jgi:hypothetical protein